MNESVNPMSVSNASDNGYANTMVYLAGKDEIWTKPFTVEEDGTPHLHKTNKQGSSTVVTTESTSLLKIDSMQNLDRIISVLESQRQK